MSQLQNKNVCKLKNIAHRAVHFPMGTSKVCNKISIIIIIIIIVPVTGERFGEDTGDEVVYWVHCVSEYMKYLTC